MLVQKQLLPRQARYAFYVAAVTGGRKGRAADLAGYNNGRQSATAISANPLVRQLVRAYEDVSDADLVAEEITDDEFVGSAA